MATESASGLSSHMRGVTVTTLASLAGVIAALVSATVFGTSPTAASGIAPLAVVGGALAVQFPVLQAIGVDVSDFGLKDNLYVAFMTFTFWFISYGIVLSANL